jgi:isocitrate dehydrogenase
LAGKNLANPTAHVLSGVMLLRHLGLFEAAELIENAVLYTWEQGVAATGDAAAPGRGVHTSVFGEMLESNLGKNPRLKQKRTYRAVDLARVYSQEKLPARREEAGVDIFIESRQPVSEMGRSIERICEATAFRLKMISNRGTKVYPEAGAMPDLVDHYRCRFVMRAEVAVPDDAQIFDLLARVAASYRWMHVEKLLRIDGQAAYTKAQGED